MTRAATETLEAARDAAVAKAAEAIEAQRDALSQRVRCCHWRTFPLCLLMHLCYPTSPFDNVQANVAGNLELAIDELETVAKERDAARASAVSGVGVAVIVCV